MKYYVDDVFFATSPFGPDFNEFFSFWPVNDNKMPFPLNDNLYAIQKYKNQDKIPKSLIPCPLLYAIVGQSITDSPDESDYVSNNDYGYLLNFLYFTTLIHPTPIDLAYSARVLYKDEERMELDRVLPNTSLGNGSQFIVGPDGSYRSYLIPDELRESYSLYELYRVNKDNKTRHPKKLNVLINYYLSSFWNIYFEISLVIVVSALEALFNTIPKGKPGITKQFKIRISMISQELINDGYITKTIKESEAEQIYNLRCEYTHRGEFIKDWNQYKANFPYLESAREILSGTIRKCIKDKRFAKIFNDHKMIDREWPV